MSERVLIAGCGDLGQRIARRLLARGEQVFALRRSAPTQHDLDVHWLQADLTDPSSLRALPTDITQLIYAPTPGSRDESAYRHIFVDGLRNVLAALNTKTLQRIVFVSSTAVYGDHGDAWVDEETPPAPPAFNGRVLLDAEKVALDAAVPTIVMRLAGLYGPGRTHVVDALRAGHARVPRKVPHWANRIHIDDAAAAIAHVLTLKDPEHVYLGVDNTPLPLDVLYDHLAALMQVPPATEGPAPASVGSKRLSNARLRAAGFSLQWPDSRDGYAALLASH